MNAVVFLFTDEKCARKAYYNLSITDIGDE
ncbi:hypothetical protein APP90_07285 [Salmonella enterica subsp. enterica serovar Sandiego]|uniref:Uncharacterized protein n=3 Tax=Salmonella enterica TaxID=28901 RepID=A0A1S0ZL96_SALET|nr:hypothetical protein GX95_12700 [Salmonella enterica subsp. enterica serovar Minnesota]EHC36086.1 hypothetical protein SeGA_2680 [Salmonella enterica subsp. enterica serovar Gaminara str. A4-567]EHC71256.1 hypothetical protein LTSEMIN_1515 [Salmonella enterica subsp. enterica serovar Minnesota str. A4-603]EHC87756.1 hypothetical protein LTSERUB_3017 [Salmonella enterica subsp. enterica serovar Rubislaw str. A4-653]KHP28639.1 hypothetical protein QS22_05895 [Salmonella enterica subsp. enteric